MAETEKTIRLEVITPDASVLHKDVDFILVRALDGDLGIMPNHAPLIASLDIWPLFYDEQGQRSCITVTSGFLEVSNNTVTIITPAAETPENIDVERAEAAKERAEKRLHVKSQDIDVHRAELALQRALRRIETVEKYGR